MRALPTSLGGMAAIGLGTFLLLCPASPQQGPILEVGKFSGAEAGGSFPAGWKPLTFKNIDKHTVYSLVKDQNVVAVKAESQASASGLIREIKVDPREFPILQWRWKVENVLKKGNVHRKEGDDYPARIYVTFEYDPQKLSFLDRTKYGLVKAFYGQDLPLAALNYIWESHAPKGTLVPNPFTDRAMMIVVESGTEKLNQWITEERDILEDYRKAFREDPPMINGVAIMTDTDNTGESAVAYYGDIWFKKKSP
jgi:Protein of unknown function (DUF3047)